MGGERLHEEAVEGAALLRAGLRESPERFARGAPARRVRAFSRTSCALNFGRISPPLLLPAGTGQRRSRRSPQRRIAGVGKRDFYCQVWRTDPIVEDSDGDVLHVLTLVKVEDCAAACPVVPLGRPVQRPV